MKRSGSLRHGFTTGSAAAAGAKAGVLVLAGRPSPEEVDIPLPEEGRLRIPVKSVSVNGEEAVASVVKDAGDDPDVTHGAEIRTVVRLEGGEGRVTIQGGRGVGRVTKPGLPVAVGEWAVNPAPRLQITAAVKEALEEAGLEAGAAVTIEVPDGERLALKTLNPRLGILGGISILGTRGTVKPFSHESYRETIRVSMDVALAEGLNTVGLSTGGKSEKLLRKALPGLPEEAFIQVADHFAFSLREAAARGFREILYACFFGKLVKAAQGHPQTHAVRSRIDFDLLARWAAESGVSGGRVERTASANTAREALDWVQKDPAAQAFLDGVAGRALASARKFAGAGPGLGIYLFDFDGSLLSFQGEESAEKK